MQRKTNLSLETDSLTVVINITCNHYPWALHDAMVSTVVPTFPNMSIPLFNTSVLSLNMFDQKKLFIEQSVTR